MTVTFGSLDDALKRYPDGARLLLSAGAVSDAFIMSNGTRDLLNGPVGSGKTTACVKRALRSAIQTPPMISSGVRRYVLAVWRETYQQLWGTTIKSWRKVLDPDKGIGTFTGSFPRAAEHVVEFEDAFGKIQLIARFMAFGADADPDDLGGTEYTDAYLNEMDKLPEALFINLARSVGRDPTRGELGLPDRPGIRYGRIFGDCNAPSPLVWVYRDWWSPKKPAGYHLFRQPGGRHAEAENLAAVGRQYYHQQAEANAHRPWWIRVKIDNEPGFNRDTDVVYPKFVDSRMVALEPLTVFPDIPVIVGCDGGNTPAAAFLQEMPDGQLRVPAEIALDRGDELDLARAVNVVMASRRFAGCEFYVVADPATFAGDDTTGGSWAGRLGKAIGLKVHKPPVRNEDTEGRHRGAREAMERALVGDRPGFLLDPSCSAIRRGLNGTFHYHRIKGTDARGGIVKTPDSHVVEAMEYGASLSGSSAARHRTSEHEAEKRRKREASRKTQGRYNALRRQA
ncbi:hypothetical protein [Chelatococcus asaccharovorans]|uniref:Terminase family protein n=1 Tax=Chelatococcus asaccharovorans TaxID=28210 RepID=A0A2V3UAG6_9HYPH|nr:hypothetical protein [Chelatococcus asaccharovorans]MBS7703185.1 hypothetical protein [Chelatococcus asaccharovorans]PXW61514.1 hypothetical protein C7450_10329 [Chelatococcus asaccharovorans]